MRLYCALLLLPAGFLFALAGAVSGGGDKGVKAPAAPTGPGLVEVRFTNGSVVVMTMLQDQIEIVTEYGKLIVPPRDIRQIEFGLHLTDEEKRKLDEAVQHLGSTSNQERERASNDLVAMGPMSYMRVQSAAKSTDLEVARRAEAALKSIRDKYPAKLLRAREEDMVKTNKFSIVGHITTPTIKAKADDFGDLDLRPGRLLAIRTLGGDSKKEVVVDAGMYGGPGNNKWMATSIRLEAAVGVRITATGQVDLLPQGGGPNRICGPEGLGGAMMFGRGGRFFNNGGQTGGELMGKVGDNGQMFYIGTRHTLTPKTSGQLFLLIQQSPWGCPSAGEYRVTVASGVQLDDAEAED
jgi:hypothetical protein